jgi:hypothetical protein
MLREHERAVHRAPLGMTELLQQVDRPNRRTGGAAARRREEKQCAR